MPRHLIFGSVLVTPFLLGWTVAGCGDDGAGPADATVLDGGTDSAVDGAPPAPLTWVSPENISQTATYSDLRVNWGNSLAVASTGTVHAVWREVEDPQASPLLTRIVYRRRSATTWETAQELAPTAPGLGHPKVAAAAGQVYAAWHQWDPAPTGFDQLFFARSTADGEPSSFDTPVSVVNDAPVVVSPAGELSTTPSIAAWGDHVYLAWSDDRVVAACSTNISEVYLLTSDDRGATWASPLQVSSADCRSSWTPTVASDGAAVHVAWTDDRHNTEDCGLGTVTCKEEVFYRRVEDHGTTVAADEVRLTTDPASPVESWAGNIAVSGEQVHLAWMDRLGADGWEVYYVRSSDGGSSWSLPPRALTQHASGCESVRPTVAVTGQQVHVVWFEICPDPGGDEATVYHRWSADGGQQWSDPSDVTTGQAVFAIQPSVAADDQAAHVIWTDQGEIWYATATIP